jgi:glutamine amidotransferase
MIGIIDYRRGNIRSVYKALRHLGFSSRIVETPAEMDGVERLILPGVGAFGDGMNQLESLGFAEAIREKIDAGVPFLGICLGLQLLFEESEESPGIRGLCVLPGTVRRFRGHFKIPHMGWNQVRFGDRPAYPYRGIPDPSFFYFVHSYHVCPGDEETVAGTTDYHETFVSAVHRANVNAVQFHPEKSQDRGLALLRNWVERC